MEKGKAERNNEDIRHIFIIGISRTGSKFYMQILNSHPEINIVPETVFKFPFKKDLYTLIKRGLSEGLELSELVDKIYSSTLKDTLTETLKKISPDDLLADLRMKNDLNSFMIYEIILDRVAKTEGKFVSGAKFPVHYSYVWDLEENYPNSKFLFLIRDPRDIYLSDLRLKRKGLNQGTSEFPVKGVFLKYAVFFYTIIEWYRSLKEYHRCLKKIGHGKVQLFRYENILIDRDNVIEEIAIFLKKSPSSFSTNHLRVMDSSYNKKPKLNRWKSELNTFQNFLFKLFLGRKMKECGYY